MIICAVLLAVSSLLWAALGFSGLGTRFAATAQVVFPVLLLLAGSAFLLAEASRF